MLKKLSGAVIASVLLVSGGLVGVAFAGAGGITEPEVIELSLDLCGNTCRIFELQDPIVGRQGEAWITVSDDALFDVEGNRAGRQNEHCTVSYGRRGSGTPWLCTYVLTLTDGPHTDAGTVVLTGIYEFDASTLSVVGGSGAYENVRGVATMVVVDDREVLTLNLIP